MSSWIRCITALCALVVLCAPDTHAADDSARAILMERDRRRPKAEEYVCDATVIGRNGRERRKTWKAYREGPAGASSRLLRFLSPPDVRGVAYLSRASAGAPPDEWLYLPSMKRERRMDSRDREAAFVGTSFAYEDLDLLEFDDSRYDATMLAPTTIDGAAVDAIQLTPRVRSMYAKKLLYVRRDDLALLSATFFVPRNEQPAKRLLLSNYHRIDGYQVATRIEMQDLRKGTRTVVDLRDIALDRPQPTDRFTIQNLVREDAERVGRANAVGVPRVAALTSTAFGDREDERRRQMPQGLTGYVEARTFAFAGSSATGASTWQWVTGLLRQSGQIGRARLAGSVRFEASSAPQVGAVQFDPFDRAALRSPISVRELSLAVPLTSNLELQAGRFQMAWGETDGYSPADAFWARDMSDPLAEERLPLWAVRARGQHRGLRFELIGVPETTPWRLPPLDGRAVQLGARRVTLAERPWTVPHAGFGAGRVTTTFDGWDVGAWARAGMRPVPVLVPDFSTVPDTGTDWIVPLERHYTRETAAGGQLSRDVGGWMVRAELGAFRSSDANLGNAVLWSIGTSKSVGDGTFVATVAGNTIDPPLDPVLVFDRALLPAAILAFREIEPWGSWQTAWLTTFHTVGGVLAAELGRNLTDSVQITAGADVPHGAALSPAVVFSGGKRVRAGVRWSW